MTDSALFHLLINSLSGEKCGQCLKVIEEGEKLTAILSINRHTIRKVFCSDVCVESFIDYCIERGETCTVQSLIV